MTFHLSRFALKVTCFSGLFLAACSPQVAPVSEPEPVPSISKRQGVHHEIRQENFQYQPAAAVILPSDNFIITPKDSYLAKPVSHPFPVVYFPTNGYRMSPQEEIHLLETIRECGYSGPFEVTGYTDTTGTENYNKKLSQQRAEAVAVLLRQQGFTTVKVEGRGALPGEHEGNRRVEVRPST